jgi:hypothetical protein
MSEYQLPDFTGNPDDRRDSLLPLAELLRDAVDRHFSTDAIHTPSSLDAVFDRAFADIAPDLIKSRLSELAPQEFAEVYVRILGSEALTALLDELAATKTAQLAREARLQAIRHETRTTGMLKLERLDPNEMIRIGLFDAATPHLAAKRYADNPEHRPLQRIIALRALEPAIGHIEVLHDTWVGPVWANSQKTPPLPPHSRGAIGSYTGNALLPNLSLHTPLTYQAAGSEPVTLPQIIGYIESNDSTLLLDSNL